MSQKVIYVQWPEAQIMLDCKWHRTVNDGFNSCICIKDSRYGCNCLKFQATALEDKLEELTDEPD